LDLDPLPADFIPALISLSANSFATPQVIALVIAVAALFVSGFVSGSEIAFFSLSDNQLEDIAESPRGSLIGRLLEKPEKLLATILITNNLVNVSIVVLTNFALGPVFEGMNEVLSFILQSVILTFLILLFGEILPKLYCNNYPLKWAQFAAPGVMFLTKLFSPLSRLLVGSTAIVNKVVTKETHNISTDELSQALTITDVNAGSDKQMLEGILRFGDTTASEIMTPRISIVGIEADEPFEEVMKIIIEHGYSRMPVWRETQDSIEGILYARDLLPYIEAVPENFDWHRLLRQPFYVPEARMIDDLMEDFRKLKIHMAIVVDEFGGTQGIVTLEDILEEIVGDIDDEYDQEDKLYTRLSDDTFNFEGRIPLTDFFRITGLDADDYSDMADDAETLAGMLLAIKGDFPKEKESLVYGRCRFLVLKLADHRITLVRVKVMPDDQTSK